MPIFSGKTGPGVTATRARRSQTSCKDNHSSTWLLVAVLRLRSDYLVVFASSALLRHHGRCGVLPWHGARAAVASRAPASLVIGGRCLGLKTPGGCAWRTRPAPSLWPPGGCAWRTRPAPPTGPSRLPAAPGAPQQPPAHGYRRHREACHGPRSQHAHIETGRGTARILAAQWPGCQLVTEYAAAALRSVWRPLLGAA